MLRKVFIRSLAVRTGEEKKKKMIIPQTSKSNTHKSEINIFLSASHSVTSADSNMADPVTYAETCTVSHSASKSCQSSIHLKSVLSTPLPCPRPCSPARLNRPPAQRTVQTGAIEHSERLSIAYFLLRFKIQLLQLPQLSDPSQEEEGKRLRQKLP